MSNADFKELLDRYLTDTLSVDELHELLGHLQKYENTEALRAAIQQALTENAFKDLSDKSRTDLIFNKIMQQARNEESPVAGVGRIWRWTAAAAVLIAIIGGIYLLRTPRQKNIIAVSNLPPASNDVSPGRNKAILQLADSSTIVLDDSDTGLLAQQGTTKILKLNNGQLSYHCLNNNDHRVLYNVISTPRGGQYQVVLPDGTKVWLNAASSLRFPTAFTGKERNVTVTGEAYFEISPNRNMPFRVQAGDTKVEVLGTHFNIMAYDNEDMINTTLLEGAVRVSGQTGDGVKLKPGQQATFSHGSGDIRIHEVDTESVVAWKNGSFQFDKDDIPAIMRQLERWYDVDVHYAGKIPEGHYSWTVTRDKSLLKVLMILEESDLKFKIEGKDLTVL